MGNTIGPLNASMQFDFTRMTRGQAVSAANTLLGQGKISSNEAGVLDGFACAYAAGPNGEGAGDTFSATDPTEFNFMSMIYQASAADHGVSLAEQNDQSLLRDLSPYSSQSKNTPSI